MATNKKSGFLSGIGYLGGRIVAGFMQSVEGIWDFAAGGLADLFGADEWAKKQMSTDWFGDWYNTAGDWFDAKGGWKTAGDVAGGIGSTLPAVVTALGGAAATALTGGAYAPVAVKAIALSIAPLTAGLGAAGTSTKEAMQKTGKLTGKEYGYGALSGALEGGIEALTGGLGTGTARIAKSAFKSATKTAAQEAAEAVAKKTVKSVAWKAAKRAGTDFVSEGFEEGLTELVSPYLQRLTYDPSAENATAEEIAYAALVGGLAGSIVGTAGGAVGAGASAIMDAKIGKDAIEAGQAEEILSVAAQISKQVESGEAGYEVLAAVDTVYKQLAGTVSAPADIATLPQKAQLGKLKKLLSVTRILPDVENSAKVILANPEAVVARYNELGITDENGNAITAEKLTEGIETDASGRATILSLRKAISQNRVLGTLAIAEATGRLMVDHETYLSNATTGGYLGGRAQYQDFVANASPEQKAALAKLVGVENLDAVDYETFAKRMIEYGNSPEGSAKIRSARDIRKTAENIPENEKTAPPAVSAAMKDGVHRFGGADGIAIIKNGDTVRIYDYATKNTTRPMTVQEATAALQKARRASSPEIMAEKVESGRRYSLPDVDTKADFVYTKEQYERFGWAREIGAITKNEMDDLESKIKIKRSTSDFKHSEQGEFIVEVNDDPKAHLKVNNVFVFLEGTKSRNTITRVIRFDARTETEMEDLTREIIRNRTFDDTSFRFFAEFGFATEYARQDAPSFDEYRGHQGAEQKVGSRFQTDSLDRVGDQRRGDVEGPEGDGSRSVSKRRSALPKSDKSTTQSGKNTTKSREISADEIAAFAKENVKGYEDLLPAEQREIRAMIRQGKALGVPDADIKTYATVSARSGIRVAFSKERTVYTKEDGTTGYADGFYDPVKNEIVVNPEGTRSPGKLLMHELSHALYSYKKYRAALDKATRRMDEARAEQVAKRYREAGESAAVISEELAVHHAEDVLGSRANLERVVEEEPNIKSKILSFFRVAKSAYQGDERLSLNAGRLYRHFEKAFNDFAARNRGNLAAETVTLTNPENTQVSADGKRYALNPYSDRQKENWKNSKSIIVYEDEGQYRAFIERSIAEGDFSKKLYFGAIGADLAALIESKTGLNLENFNCTIKSSEIRKIVKEHGNDVKESMQGQRAIGISDFLSIPEVFQEADNIWLSPKLYNGKPAIHFERIRGNERMTVVAIVSDKHLDLFVQTQYVNVKKGTLATPLGEQAPKNTPEASRGTDSTISIPDSAKKINPSDENSSRRKALPDTTEAVGKTKKRYEPSKKDIFFTAKDRAYIETVDELYGIEKYLHKIGGTAKAAVEADVQLARAARSQAQTMIGSVQYNVFSDKPERMGDGLLEIYKPTRLWSQEKYTAFDIYLLHQLNIDRMTLESRSKAWTAAERAQITKVEGDIKALGTLTKSLRSDIKKADNAIIDARVDERTAKTAAEKADAKKKVAAAKARKASLQAQLKQAEQDTEAKTKELERLRAELKALELKNKPVFGKDETLDEQGNMKRDHDITADESRAIVAECEKKYPEFAEIAKKLYTYLDNLQTMRVEAGLISRESADYMKKLYPHYVPSYRDTEGGGVAIVKGKNNLEISRTVRKAKGGNQDILDVASSIATQTDELMKAGRINQLAAKLYDAAKSSGDTSWVQILSEESVGEEESFNDILRPKPGQLTFYRDGKKVTMEVSKEILLGFEALRSPTVDLSNPLERTMAKINSLFKRGVTSLNPAFMLRNPIRDLQKDQTAPNFRCGYFLIR